LFLTGAAGVSVVAVAGVSAWLALSGSSEAYETPVGGRRSVLLTDGSRIELNAASRVVVRYGDDLRRVSLERGEAFFEVHPDPRPFVIETRFGDLRVADTAVSIKIGETAARATVLRGAVEVVERGAGALRATAQEEVTLARESSKTEVAAPVIERRLAWRRGMLAFDGDTLEEAVLEVSRQTGARFEFGDPELAQLRVGGYIRATDLDAFLTLLEANLDITARRGGQTIILQRSAAD
jgi:transmembrane sensor